MCSQILELQGRSLEAKMSKALVKTAIGCNELGGGIKSDQVWLAREEVLHFSKYPSSY